LVVFVTVIMIVIVLVAVILVTRRLFRQKDRASSWIAGDEARPLASAQQPTADGIGALVDLATSVRPRGTSDLTKVIQIRITDQVPADWHFDLAQGQCSLAQGRSDGASLTLSASAQTWRELAAKRISFAGAYMKGSVQAEGDNGILMRLDDEFSGPVDPTRRAEVYKGQDQDLATIDAPWQGVGPTTDVRTAEDGPITVGTTSISTSSSGTTSGDDMRAALFAALGGLPPGSSREQQKEALRAALVSHQSLGNLLAGATPAQQSGAIRISLVIRKALANLPPNATPAQKREAIRAALGEAAFGTGVLGEGTTGHQPGVGDKLTETVLEGLAETLLEGLFGGG
jgi:hypothetical protein